MRIIVYITYMSPSVYTKRQKWKQGQYMRLAENEWINDWWMNERMNEWVMIKSTDRPTGMSSITRTRSHVNIYSVKRCRSVQTLCKKLICILSSFDHLLTKRLVIWPKPFLAFVRTWNMPYIDMYPGRAIIGEETERKTGKLLGQPWCKVIGNLK